MEATLELEQEILDIINIESKGEYLGKLKVIIDNVNGEEYYTLLLHLNQEQAPMHLGCPGPEDAFKEYIRDEIRRRKLHLIRRWQGFKIYPDPENPCDETEWEGYEFPVIPF